MKKQYYAMNKSGNEANINIYGDISSYADEPSAKTLINALEELGDVSQINVYISSYGGEVAEGLAIYNALKRHKARIITYCDGFAASIASVIFMAGEERIMNESSLLMIHNAWSFGEGNAEQLRKQADDLDKITQASVAAYKANSTLSEEEIKTLMDNETWILPEEALEYGFATSIEKDVKRAASQNAKARLIDIIKMYRQETDPQDEDEGEEEPEKPAEDDEAKDGEEPAAGEGNAADGENGDSDGTSDGADTEEPENDQPPEDGDEEEKKAEQKLFGFFNAILKM